MHLQLGKEMQFWITMLESEAPPTWIIKCLLKSQCRSELSISLAIAFKLQFTELCSHVELSKDKVNKGTKFCCINWALATCYEEKNTGVETGNYFCKDISDRGFWLTQSSWLWFWLIPSPSDLTLLLVIYHSNVRSPRSPVACKVSALIFKSHTQTMVGDIHM